MAGLVMMACGLRGAEAGMTQHSWHGCQTLDVNMNAAWRVQGARQHNGSDGCMRSAGCLDSGAGGQWECACVGAALGAAPGDGQAGKRGQLTATTKGISALSRNGGESRGLRLYVGGCQDWGDGRLGDDGMWAAWSRCRDDAGLVAGMADTRHAHERRVEGAGCMTT